MNNKNPDALSQLEPKPLWQYFQQLCEIPHPSHHEEKVIAYLEAFAKEHQLDYTKDSGNIIIRKPATKGMENCKTVILQGHVDMVPQKNKNTQHNFEKDPIKPYIDGEWVTADGTTLGADNGIGACATLAILATSDIKHGPIEALFTVDEEDGMGGAHALSKDVLHGDILLNLDTEEDDQLYIGCAGGISTDMTMPYNLEDTPNNVIAYTMAINGLKGGHSGIDINLGRGSAIKLLNRILWEATDICDLRIADYEGGSVQHNAIPREAHAIVTVPTDKKDDFLKLVDTFKTNFQAELKHSDAGVNVDIEESEIPKQVMDRKHQVGLLNAIYICPHGMADMSPDIPGLVQTSTNLAHVETKEGTITIFTLQRGSVNSLMDDLANAVFSTFNLLEDAKVAHADRYPGWNPNMDSEILKLTKSIYKDKFGEEPEVMAIHAGLECGLLISKYPNMDAISLGPTITGAHSPDERVNIKSVQKFWDYLLAILENIPQS